MINSNLQRPTAKYPSNPTVSLQCPWQRQRTLQCPTHSIAAVLSGKVSLSCQALDTLIPTACAPAVPNCNIIAVRLQCFKEDSLGGRATLHLLCNNGFRVGMLDVNISTYKVAIAETTQVPPLTFMSHHKHLTSSRDPVGRTLHLAETTTHQHELRFHILHLGT